MAGTEQLQVDSLLQCLHGCLVNDPDVRKEAEAALAAGAERPGFGVALARLLLQSDLQYGMRQLAAVLLKQYIKQHWVEASLLFAGFPTSEEDKGALRQLLLPALSDAHSKLRVSAGVCVACIAQWDWPDLWPELLPFLIDSIRARRSHAAVHGALSCLALVAEDVREELIPAALNHLLPELQAMVSMHCQRQQQQQQGAGAGEDEEEADRVSHMARKALSIFRQLLSLTFSMPNELRRAIRDQMVPVLPAWMQLLSALLRAPMQAEAVGDWGVRMEALRLACRLLVAGLGKALAPHVPALLQDAWQLLASALPLYQRDVVAGESQDHGFQDSEGDAMDLESLCCQLYELLLTVVGVERYQPLLQDSLKPLLGVTLQYMQLTQPQLAAWAHEVEQYVQDEEVEGLFGGSLRSTCQCLLAELVTVYESTALAALSAAVQQALAESAEMRSRGEAAWWRLQESSFLAVGAVAMELRDMDGSGSGSGRRRSRKAAAPPGLDAAAVLEAVVLPEISGVAPPLPLLGRALWVVARYAWLVPPNRQLAYLQACTIGLQDGMPAAVAIASFRSCTAFLSRLQAEQVRPFLPRLYQAVSSMLGTASADALPLLLEALAAIVRCDEATATACEPQVSPALLQLWRSYADHPDILPAALEVLHAFVAFPSCIPGLASRCVPPLVQVLASFRTQAPAAAHIVAGALDLLTVLAVPGNRAAARHIFQEAAPHAVNLLIASGDPAVVQNATELLVALVSAGRAELLGGWSVPEAAAGQLLEAASARKQTLDAFLRAVDFLLRRDLGDSPSLRAGELLGVMLMHWPADMAPYVPKLLAAAAGKLAATGSAPVIVSLLGAMCDVAVQDADSFISLMASTSVPDQDGRVVPALPLLLQIWTDHHLDFYGEYAVHRSVSGLIALTATRRPEILAIQIQRPNPAAAAAAPEGVMTRAKARMLKSQARTAATVAVPFPQRLFAILSETLHDEMQRERSADDGMVLGLPEDLLLDDDEDWEEEEDKDGDEDEEEIDDDEGAGPALAVHGIGRGMSLLEEEDCHPQPSRTASGGNRSEIHLLTYLKEQIRGIVAADPDFVQSCAHLLTAAQKAAVEATITDAGP